jgi:hypothetical protein
MTCEFPSKQLHAERWKAIHIASSTRDHEVVDRAMKVVLAIDNLRLAHEDLTDCQCWYSAVKEAEEKP